MKNDISNVLPDLHSLKEESKSFPGHLVYCEIHIRIIELLLQVGDYSEASKELFSPDFENFCSKNIYFNSYRNYLMGWAAKGNKTKEFQPYLSYYEESFNELANISITDLTWRVLFKLSYVYEERGNISRAKEFGKYAKQTISYIVDQMKSNRIKTLYLSHPERQKAISFLN